MNHELTPEQQIRLAEQGADVAQWLELVRKSMAAVRCIRDNQLYKPQFASWEGYCQHNMSMTAEQVDLMADTFGLPENN